MLKELDNKDTQMTAGNATGYTSELSEKLLSPELTCTAVMLAALYRFIYFRNGSRQFSEAKLPASPLLPMSSNTDFSYNSTCSASARAHCVKKLVSSAASHLENEVPLLHILKLLLEIHTNYCCISGETPSPLFLSLST